MTVAETNDPKLRSWVSVSAGSDFPIQNLPFGICQYRGGSPYAAVAIGDAVLNLSIISEEGYLRDTGLPSGIFKQQFLNDFLAYGRGKIRSVRSHVSRLLREGDDTLPADVRQKALVPQREVTMMMPVKVPNYTDFYSSEEHAINVGSMFRDPKSPLLPNWKHLPVGYHGRASSIVVSGTPVHRPKGQVKAPDKPNPDYSVTRKLDFELELAFITCKENPLGRAVTVAEAEEYIAGFVIFNDWSARDLQQWEYVPLGPFSGKNFASTISPWIVTLDALEPFRVTGPPQEPEVLPYLRFSGRKNFDIILEADIQPEGGEYSVLCRTNARYLYWNVNQQLAHHTVNGCNVQVGDLYASGTISGPSPGSFGSMLELSWNGEKPLTLAGGGERTFLGDGDTVKMRGYASAGGVRIGFGECTGKILPAI